jgi:proteasome lid subunit RPN8/RPN11
MFQITERQYKLIMKQAQAAYPQETGGILGGRDSTILGVLPIANKVTQDRTEVFGITAEDIERAFHFLVRHKLEYLGVYHTHPRGVPIPSEQDLSHRQKYLFIVGLADRYNPELYAWRVTDGKIYPENIKIISDMGVTVVDIYTGKPKLSQSAPKEELDRIANQVEDMIKGIEPKYKKLGPVNWDASSFSALA